MQRFSRAGLFLAAVLTVSPAVATQATAATDSASTTNATGASPVIESSSLRVRTGAQFPYIVDYTDRATGAVLDGRAEAMDSVVLNGTSYRAEGVATVDGSTVRYRLTFPGLDGLRIDAHIAVDGSQVTFRIDKITDTEAFRVSTISIPGHNLLSVRGDQPGAHVTAARVDPDKNGKGDTFTRVTGDTPADVTPQGSAYAIVNTDRLAAAIETNSVQDEASSENTRVQRQAVKTAGTSEVGVSSGQWTYRAKGSPFTEELPWAKIVVTGDRNTDDKVDWQDGAIAFRSIEVKAKGSDETPDRVVTHIPFNFASYASNPFLKTLDNVKRISLATDGLGQLAILKGYAQEGHDSAHPDYGGNYNTRAGGLADLNVLAKEGKKWGASFGVHVNSTEAYPEAKAFSDKLVDPKAEGWDWLGQSYYIDQRRDLTSGDIAKRFQQLRDETDPNLKFLYMDVYYSHGWKSDRLQTELRKQGWQLGTEWGDKMERSSLWSHWANEPSYGGDANRGINSKVIRFIRNGEKDVWIDNPLLGSANIKEWEGWGNQNDWTAFYANIWNRNLPAKFLQKQQITEWTDHEVKLTGGVRVTDASGTRQVFVGSDKVQDGSAYLLPWTGSKAYHWNPAGGTSTWPVPKQWKNEDSVTLYKLTDQGRVKVGALPVQDGKVTIEAEKGQPYVLYRNDTKKPQQAAFGQGSHVTDPGFNSGTLKGWQTDGPASVKRNALGQYEAVVPGSGTGTGLTTTLRDLTRGKRYAASVWAQVQPGRTRKVTLAAGGAENWIDRSTAKDAVGIDEKGGTYFQRITVRFTAKAETAQLKVAADAGDAEVKLDDVRVVETTKSEKAGTVAHWDFEDNEQGWGPFVQTEPGNIRTVRSEKHAPYTNAGWNGQLTDQTIDGDHSLKSHEEGAQLVYRTIPQTVRFEPGHRYKVSFDYQNAFAGQYALSTGYDQLNATGAKTTETEQILFGQQRTTARYDHEFTAGDCGDYYVGIRKVGSALDQSDFIIDDFTVTDLGETDEAASCATLAVQPKSGKLTPGTPNKVDVAFTNGERIAATGVKTELAVPEGWTAQPETSDTLASVAPGATGKVTWNVTPKPGIPAGSFTLNAKASYTAGEKKSSAGAAVQVGTVPPNYVPQDRIKVVDVDSQETEGENTPATNALDGDPATWWGTAWSASSPNYPHHITLDLGDSYTLKEFKYLPRQDQTNDRIKEYEVYLSADGQNWGQPVAKGAWPDSADEQTVTLGGRTAQFIKLVALSSVNGQPWAGAAELNVLTQE
ncbi:endo-alpha-N-acetylgalactosaminidase family protein [Streptomyces sp. RKAG290]|uniref:endo-alpha-N-acetylgalactosaminidase family protein n=1 Tax=Streptomyces sp. RKAG290 TaxID=2888348 RepID=UPI0020339A02|nr:endo-alpha-N-acetylgalactosaminidase family protein [Streptomyces sp. RKAG290]MCM2416018.1 endo-alpha-N-acetylgalactosaminidase family protein [Streptomyces sp. RKAG290]